MRSGGRIRIAMGVVGAMGLVACGGDDGTESGGDPAPSGPAVFGQPDEATNDALRLGLALPNDLMVVGSRLVVADQNNNRVLIWNALPAANHAPADLVLGQPDFTTNQPDYGGLGPRSFRGTNAVASDGTRLIVGDRFNNRVLIWNTFPTESFQAADVVLGQPNFTTSTPNTEGVSARSMTEPWVWLCGERLFVSDRNNVRVLVWNSIPAQSYTPADFVLGQPDMTSTTPNHGGAPSAQNFGDPGRGVCDGNRLLIPDLANHRVLVWNTIPTQTQAPADLVLGQPDMLGNSPNAGGAASSRSGLSIPIAVFAQGDSVAVADYDNHRVLLWTAPITQNGQSSDVVLGQADAAGNQPNRGGDVTASSLWGPNAIASDGMRWLVSDRFNHRILVYSSLPASDGAPADLVVGQPDLVSGALNNSGAVSAGMLAGPSGLARTSTGLAVAEFDNARVVLWDRPPASATDLPSVVLGQPDFTSSGLFEGTTSALSLCGPVSVHFDGMRLLVGEQCSRRIALWNELPASNQQPLDVVVGQPNPTSSEINAGGLSASSLSNGPRAHSDGTRLFVADAQNHRVLIWNSVPSANGAPADVVLGQPDMTSGISSNGGIGANTLARPTFVYTSGERLFVADTNSNRVLVWNTIPATTGAPADLVLGQPNMTSSAVLPPSARSLYAPSAVHVDASGRLYVADTGNHRILYWNAIPTSDEAPADGVIGQPNLNSALANNGGLSAQTLQSPGGVVDAGERIYVADTGNHRLVILPRP